MFDFKMLSDLEGPGLRGLGALQLCLLALAVAVPVGAQEHRHAGDTEHHEGLHFAHPMFTESVSPDTKVRLDFAGVRGDEEDETEVELEAEYAFHRSFSVEVGAPYVFADPAEGASVDALGNLELGLKFANFAFEDAGLLLGYGVEVGLPTGDRDTGIGSEHIWELEPFLNVGFKRDRLELVGWTKFGIPTNQRDGEEIETEFHYDVSALYHFHPRFQGLLELNGASGLSGEEAGQGTVFLSPGVKLAPVADTPFFVGLAGGFPVDEDEVDARFRLSLFYHF